jgi:hypothetical protein
VVGASSVTIVLGFLMLLCSWFAVLEEEGSVFESPTICTVYARRRTTEAEAVALGRGNPTITNKGKEPVGAAASCPPLGKSTRNIR